MPTMVTDLELATFLGIDREPRWPQLLATIPKEKQQALRDLVDVAVRLALYNKGMGPKPEGVIVCRSKSSYRHRRTRCFQPPKCQR
jgi:hypothetical protein